MKCNFIMASFECSVCVEKLSSSVEDKQPHKLNCSHSFCFSCLEKLVQNNSISCPVCSGVTSLGDNGAKELKKNLILMELLDGGKPKTTLGDDEKEILCLYCDAKTTFCCISCIGEPSICESCFPLTHGAPKTKNHKLTSNNNKVELYCIEHQEFCKLYCYDDMSFVCLMCAHYGDHKDHKKKLIKDAAKFIRERASIQSDEIESQLIKIRQEEMKLKMQKIPLQNALEKVQKCVNETSDSNLLQSWSEFSQAKFHTLSFDKDNCRGVNISDDGLYLKTVGKEASESNLSYALGKIGIFKGFCRYQFKIDKDIRNNEIVCIGIATKQFNPNMSYEKNPNLWILRGFNGNFYSKGITTQTNGKFSVGDIVTVEVDMNLGTINFLINDMIVKLPNNSLEANNTYYPIVLIYYNREVEVSIQNQI